MWILLFNTFPCIHPFSSSTMQPELFPITSENKWIPVAKHTVALSFFWQVIFSPVNISETPWKHFSVAGMKSFHSWQQGMSLAVALACCSVSLSEPHAPESLVRLFIISWLCQVSSLACYGHQACYLLQCFSTDLLWALLWGISHTTRR